MVDTFECDNCGACCKTLIVEAGYIDALREPRLLEVKQATLPELRDDGRVLVLYDANTCQCPFLNDDCRCSIYATRPNECVSVQAGDAKCQQSRHIYGLEILKTVDGRAPDIGELEASCIEYGLEIEDVGLGEHQ